MNGTTLGRAGLQLNEIRLRGLRAKGLRLVVRLVNLGECTGRSPVRCTDDKAGVAAERIHPLPGAAAARPHVRTGRSPPKLSFFRRPAGSGDFEAPEKAPAAAWSELPRASENRSFRARPATDWFL